MELYTEDRSGKKTKDDYYEDDPWENYGELYEGDEKPESNDDDEAEVIDYETK